MLVFGMLIEAMAQSIQGTAWTVVELYGTPVSGASVASDGQPYLVFGANGQMSGADGCNRLTGPYSVTANDISFGHVAGTQTACPNTDSVAQRFRSALANTSQWRIVMGRLEFYGDTDKPLAVFEQRPASSGSPVTLKAQHGDWLRAGSVTAAP